MDDSPQTILVCGQPGVGKTTFLRHFVRNCSKNFLMNNQNSDSLHENQLTTIVYLEGKSIKGTIKDAIRDNLRCKKKDRDLLMDHIEEGDGVAIVIEAIDEIYDEAVKVNLREYVSERKQKRGAQVVVSSRTDHCPIQPICFDRILNLQGFSIKQGIGYVEKHFSNAEAPVRKQTMEYVNKHKYNLEGILSNPLRLHVFCALTSAGDLKLKEDSVFDIVILFELLEGFLVNRESKRAGLSYVTEKEKQNFYKMCLYSILTGQREFSEPLLESFQVPKSYLVFFDKSSKMDQNAELQNFYSFRHHVLFEYFASRCINPSSPIPPITLLLSIARQIALRNVQKIIFQTILKWKQNKDQNRLLLTLTFGVLFLQNEKRISIQQAPETLLKLWQCTNMGQVEDIILRENEANVQEIKDAWESLFQDLDDQANILRLSGWFHDLEENGTIRHVVECLEYCTPQQRENLTRETLYRFLPCKYDQDDGEHTVLAVGRTRWGHVLKTKAVFIKAWSVDDTYEALVEHRKQHPAHPVSRMEMNINYFKYRILWGKATDATWSQEAWNRLMRFLTDTWTLKKLSIYLPYTCPLSGLLDCVACFNPEIESQRLFIEVHYGTVSLEDLEKFVDTCEEACLSIVLVRMNIIIPGRGEDIRLRKRRDELCATKAGQGQEIVQDMFWVKENGERYIWSDGK